MLDTTPSTPRARTRRVSIAEAARILGVSGETVRRHIHAGKLEAVREVRPQGSAWRVVLPIGRGVVSPRGGHGTPRVEPHQEPAQATEATPVEAIPLESAADFAPLVAALAATLAQVSERLDGTTAELSDARRVIVGQAETIGRQGAELEASRAEVTRVIAERDAAELSRRRDTRRLSIALAVAGALAVAAGTAPAWVRIAGA